MRRRLAPWIRANAWNTFTSFLLGMAIAVPVGTCLLGARGRLKPYFPGVQEDVWFSAATTVLAASVAAGIALYVLGRQLYAQQERDRQNKLDADERDRRAHEVSAAAELSAHLAREWPLAESNDDFIPALQRHKHQPASAPADLHRLTAVWINWTEERLWPLAGVHPRQLLSATSQAGDVLRKAALDSENLAAQHFFRPIFNEAEGTEFQKQAAAHNFLERLAHDVVVMPLWSTEERADTIRDWMTTAKAAQGPTPDAAPSPTGSHQ